MLTHEGRNMSLLKEYLSYLHQRGLFLYYPISREHNGMYNCNIVLLKGSQAYPACPSDKNSNKIKTSVKRCCNGTYGKTKALEKKKYLPPEQI